MASDGDEALAVARKEVPNLIIMDSHLPSMDGVACCREIKSDPRLKHIPVIMLTNTVKSVDFEEYRAAGFSDFLPKPVDNKMFFTTVKKYVPGIERRWKRVPLCTEVRLTGINGFDVGMTKNVSPKGIYITTELQPSPDEELNVSFVLPGSEVPTEARAKVAWFSKRRVDEDSRTKTGFGAEFIEITGKGIPIVRKSELETFVTIYAGALSVDPLMT
jgi:CheY-like chemotaxis protein